jgi:membrane protease YdiL (CAAX protease family)
MKENSLLRRFRDSKEKFSPCKELAITFALFFLPAIVAPPQISGTEFNNPAFLTTIIITGLAQTAMILYLLTHIGGRKAADYGILPLKPKALLWGVLAGVLIFPLPFLLALGLQFLPREWLNAAQMPFRWSYTDYTLMPLALLGCLVTGYKEELYFRAYMLTEFFRLGMPFFPGVIICAALFGAGHIYQGAAGFAAAGLLGLYLTWIFRRAKNLHVPAIAHGLYNFYILILSGFLGGYS